MGELKRKMDWVGRYVRLTTEVTTNGGAIFEAGEIMLVEKNFGGLHLVATRNCSECGQRHRLRVIKIPEWQVVLLPNTYIPPERGNVSYERLQRNLERAKEDNERLNQLLSAAKHALQSYAYGNSSPELALEVVQAIEQ